MTGSSCGCINSGGSGICFIGSTGCRARDGGGACLISSLSGAETSWCTSCRMVVGPDCANNGMANDSSVATIAGLTVLLHGVIDSLLGLQKSQFWFSLLATTRAHLFPAGGALLSHRGAKV